jgi:sugar lactone lactonase YvrE
LWEAENFRLVTDDAALYVLDQPGITPASFKDTVNYMKRVGALLWADEKSKTIVVTHEAKEQLQSFVAETMQANVTVLY